MWRCGACARSRPQRKNSADATCSTGSTTANKDFNPEMYAKLYKELADEQDSGKSLSYRHISHDGPKAAVVNMTAETKDGPTAKHFAELAKKNNRYIIYGASEMPEGGPITENGKKKVYNSAFICSPDGAVDTYQKIHRAGAEDQ